jgi:hypothetical protein
MQKLVETGIAGGEHSEAHKAIVIGDTGGLPFKNTCGSSLNILIKLMTIVSLVIIGIATSYHSFEVSSANRKILRQDFRRKSCNGKYAEFQERWPEATSD